MSKTIGDEGGRPLGTNILLASASQYVSEFRWHLKQCGVDLMTADELVNTSALFALNDMPKVVLDHPLGLSKSVRSFCLEDLNYVGSSWQALLQGLSTEASWQAFCPWLWLRSYVIKQITVPFFCHQEVRASSEMMPFYLLEDATRVRKIAVRYRGSWYGDVVCDQLTQSLDAIFFSQILTVECVLQYGQWCFLQTYPGLPWGHYVKDPVQIMPLLSDLFKEPLSQGVSISRRFRPFCRQ